MKSTIITLAVFVLFIFITYLLEKKKELPNTPINEPVEIYFSKRNIMAIIFHGFLNMFFGGVIFLILIVFEKGCKDYKEFLLLLGGCAVAIFSFFKRFLWGLRRLAIKSPILILYPDCIEYFDIHKNKTIVYWQNVVHIRYYEYDDYLVWVNRELVLTIGQDKKILFDIRGLDTDETLYNRICTHLNIECPPQ